MIGVNLKESTALFHAPKYLASSWKFWWFSNLFFFLLNLNERCHLQQGPASLHSVWEEMVELGSRLASFQSPIYSDIRPSFIPEFKSALVIILIILWYGFWHLPRPWTPVLLAIHLMLLGSWGNIRFLSGYIVRPSQHNHCLSWPAPMVVYSDSAGKIWSGYLDGFFFCDLWVPASGMQATKWTSQLKNLAKWHAREEEKRSLSCVWLLHPSFSIPTWSRN